MFNAFRADLVADVEGDSAAFAFVSVAEFRVSLLSQGLAGLFERMVAGNEVACPQFN